MHCIYYIWLVRLISNRQYFLLKEEREMGKINLLLILFIILSLFTACGGNNSSGGSADPVGDRTGRDGTAGNSTGQAVLNNYEKDVFNMVNNHRRSLGLNSLLWHEKAIYESQGHSQDMASFRVPFGHTGSSERFSNIKANETRDTEKLGENVAQNSNSSGISHSEVAFKGWLRSYGHRKNIEGDYTHTGIGARQSDNGSWYFTQIFIKVR